MSWNGYPSYTRNVIVSKLNKSYSSEQISTSVQEDERNKIWIKLPYLGNMANNIKERCFRKIKRCLKEDVRFVTCYNTKKSAMFCSSKDILPTNQKANVIYCLSCPGCQQDYIGKTDRNIETRLLEHGTRADQPMFQHLVECEYFKEITDIMKLPDIEAAFSEVNEKNHILNAVKDNFRIIDTCDNWSQLSYLEAYYIKSFNPLLNDGLKASRELVLFK